MTDYSVVFGEFLSELNHLWNRSHTTPITAFSTMTVLLRFSFVTMLKPVSLKCGHSGCQICMEEHVRKAVNPTCPICRAVINDETLSVNIALDNLTKEMPVRCVISGCDWTGVYGSAKSHYERCPKVEVTCEQDGCEQQLPREEMPAHEETCGKKRIRCSECRRAVKRESMEHHQASVCVNAVIYCPLRCETSLPRYDLIGSKWSRPLANA